jgi:formamidopyrimidine-DNA glycosylase
MMWGRWHVIEGDETAVADRRERARIVVEGATAILMSAPIFEIGFGDPYENLEYLSALGPDILAQRFDRKEFESRLKEPTNLGRTIGDALLDQRICAGIGNYLRAEILFAASMDPWMKVGDLSATDVVALGKLIPQLSKLSYKQSRTVTGDLQTRMASDPDLVYVPGKEYGTRHYVFRRTNLPCLICGEPIRQLRQETTNLSQPQPDEEQKSRIVYFCARCQHVDPKLFAGKPMKLPTQTQKIRRTIMRLLTERGAETSICPSEVARALDPTNWRDLMPVVRTVADDLMRKKQIITLQKNVAVKSAASAKGPIRFALAP